MVERCCWLTCGMKQRLAVSINVRPTHNTEAEGVNGIEFASYMLASDMTGLLIFHIGVDSLLYGLVSTVSLVPDP